MANEMDERSQGQSGSVGNASNPMPDQSGVPEQSRQVLDGKAETYLREGGNIEDTADPREEAEAGEQLRQEGEEGRV
ncbi:MAG: hypothetical protein EOO16_15070 [Chitinophagaceae bacterium]|nr:MAG: hypothetical protein EOO16_15070 [Chitinophagaceae bacterium]